MSKVLYFLSEKWSSLKEKNLLPRGANSFVSEKTTFQKEVSMQELKQEVTKVVSLENMAKKLPSVSSLFKVTMFHYFIHAIGNTMTQWNILLQEQFDLGLYCLLRHICLNI